jgi:hypothetical protein
MLFDKDVSDEHVATFVRIEIIWLKLTLKLDTSVKIVTKWKPLLISNQNYLIIVVNIGVRTVNQFDKVKWV